MFLNISQINGDFTFRRDQYRDFIILINTIVDE